MRDPLFLLWPLSMLLTASFAIWRSVRRLRSLQGARKILTRDIMVSAFVGVVCMSAAALMYIVWSYNRNELLLVSAIAGLVVFFAGAIYFTRSYLRLSKLNPEQ